MPASEVLAALRSRRPYAAVFTPRARAHPFGDSLVGILVENGFAAYPLEMGASRKDVWRAARATQPDTGVAFVEYAPGDYQIGALLLGVLRWRARGAAVVLCRLHRPFHSLRQELGYRFVRSLADHELVVDQEDARRTLATWTPRTMPSRVPLANVWVMRIDKPRVDDIIDVLRCPSCKGELRISEEGLACEKCRRVHPIVDGIPVLLPAGAHAQVEEHEHEYEPGDAYNVGSEENRAWLEIGLYKRDLLGRLMRGRTPHASIDVGCGDWGLHHDVVGALGTDLSVAGDISLKLVEHARSAAIAPGRVHHLVFSAEALPFRERVFDLAYCSEVLEHLDHPERALAEIARVGDGGRVILTVPNEEITGKLEAGHVQTFGYDSFQALIRPYVLPSDVHGIFLFREKQVAATLVRPFLGLPLGPLRFRAALVMGERRPRKSLSILVDGILRRA